MIREAYNEDFCIHLEYHLCNTFQNFDDNEIRKYWCDGVLFQYHSKKYLNDKRKVIATAWIGQDGQGKYEMTIYFGKYSLRRIARNTDLINCIPNTERTDWINISIENKTIELYMD